MNDINKRLCELLGIKWHEAIDPIRFPALVVQFGKEAKEG